MIQKFLTAILMLAFLTMTSVAQNVIANVDVNITRVPEPPAKSTVRGRVFYGDTGRAVRRASVMLIPEDVSGGPVRDAGGLTDSDGYFQIKNVRAGAYFPMVNAPGVVSPMAYADFSKMGPGGSEKEAFDGAFALFEKIVVNGMTDVDVQIPAKRGGAISGRVTYADGDAAIGVKVEILRKEGESFVPVIPNFSAIMSMFSGGANQTDDRGIYRFPGLPRGEYRVKVTENITHSENRSRDGYYDPFGSILTASGSIVSAYFPDSADAEKAQLVNVEFGAEAFDINVVLPNHELRRISGKVVAGKDKKGVKNATISLKRKGETEASIFNQFGSRGQAGMTDDDGNWSFKELPKGEYQLIIEPSNNQDYGEIADEAMRAAEDAAAHAASGVNSVSSRKSKPPEPKYAKKIQEVVITDKDVSDIEIELGFGATMSGSVSIENIRDVPTGVSIKAASESEDSETSSSTGNVDIEGPRRDALSNSFKLENIVVGKTTLSVIVTDEKFYVKSALFEGRDLLAGTFELKDGDNLAGVKILLGKDVGTLTGKVLDSNKEPAKKLQFTLVPTDAVRSKNASFYRYLTTDDNGEFKTKVQGREYAVIFGFTRFAKAKKTGKFEKLLGDAIAAAQKVTVKENEITTVKLSVPDR